MSLKCEYESAGVSAWTKLDASNVLLCTEVLRGTLENNNFLNMLRVFVVIINMSLKCEHENAGVSTWAKLDGCIYKQCTFMCKSTVKEFAYKLTFEPIVHIRPSKPRCV